jgi:hypothetical protein
MKKQKIRNIFTFIELSVIIPKSRLSQAVRLGKRIGEKARKRNGCQTLENTQFREMPDSLPVMISMT